MTEEFVLDSAATEEKKLPAAGRRGNEVVQTPLGEVGPQDRTSMTESPPREELDGCPPVVEGPYEFLLQQAGGYGVSGVWEQCPLGDHREMSKLPLRLRRKKTCSLARFAVRWAVVAGEQIEIVASMLVGWVPLAGM